MADTHPLALGVVGSNGGTPQTRAVLMAADTVLFIGCRAGSVTTERGRFPAPGQCKILHIDIDPDVIGVNYATDAALVGDAKLALAALCEALGDGADDEALHTAYQAVATAKQEKFALFREYAGIRDGLIRPETVIDAVHQHAPAGAIIVADPGTPCPYFSGYYEHRQAGRYFVTNLPETLWGVTYEPGRVLDLTPLCIHCGLVLRVGVQGVTGCAGLSGGDWHVAPTPWYDGVGDL